MPAQRKFLIKFFSPFLLALAIFLFSSKVIFAQVVINEFSSGTTSDWIELYNQGTEPAQLSGLRLRDSTSSNKKDLSGEITPSGFLVVTFSNWLNNAGDVVKLIRIVGETEEVLEEIPYGDAGGLCTPTASGSIGRLPDGSSSIVRFISSSQGSSNNNSTQDPCSTPTPTPSPTPTPTPTPKSTSTPRPSPSPSKLPTSQPVLAPSPTGKILATAVSLVLGEEATPSGVTISGEIAEEPEATPPASKNFLPKIFVGLAALAILGMIVSAFLIQKRKTV